MCHGESLPPWRGKFRHLKGHLKRYNSIFPFQGMEQKLWLLQLVRLAENPCFTALLM